MIKKCVIKNLIGSIENVTTLIFDDVIYDQSNRNCSTSIKLKVQSSINSSFRISPFPQKTKERKKKILKPPFYNRPEKTQHHNSKEHKTSPRQP